MFRCLEHMAAAQTTPAISRGAAAALGVLPASALAPAADEVISGLAAAACLEAGREETYLQPLL